VIVGIESRGFIFGAAMADRLKAGVSPVRKLGKLPHKTQRASYALEYGADALEIHDDAVLPGQKVLIVDVLLATGGTAAATVGLVRSLGGDVVGVQFLIELAGLDGRSKLSGETVGAVLKY
jgi:adenine phosphoribosyltransferase